MATFSPRGQILLPPDSASKKIHHSGKNYNHFFLPVLFFVLLLLPVSQAFSQPTGIDIGLSEYDYTPVKGQVEKGPPIKSKEPYGTYGEGSKETQTRKITYHNRSGAIENGTEVSIYYTDAKGIIRKIETKTTYADGSFTSRVSESNYETKGDRGITVMTGGKETVTYTDAYGRVLYSEQEIDKREDDNGHSTYKTTRTYIDKEGKEHRESRIGYLDWIDQDNGISYVLPKIDNTIVKRTDSSTHADLNLPNTFETVITREIEIYYKNGQTAQGKETDIYTKDGNGNLKSEEHSTAFGDGSSETIFRKIEGDPLSNTIETTTHTYTNPNGKTVYEEKKTTYTDHEDGEKTKTRTTRTFIDKNGRAHSEKREGDGDWVDAGNVSMPSPSSETMQTAETGEGIKTLSGTVTNNDGYKETTFKTPNGNVEVFTTSDQDESSPTLTLSGTVRVEPKGKSEKEKQKNLNEMEKLSLIVGATTVALVGADQAFNYKVPETKKPFRVTLDSGNVPKQGVEWPTPKVPVTMMTGDMPKNTPGIFTNQSVFLDEKHVPVFSLNHPEALFNATDHFFATTSDGEKITLKPIAQSPGTSVLELPENITPGQITISRERSGKPTDSVNIYYFDLELTSPNTNLGSGQKSYVIAEIVHGKTETMPMENLSIDMKNLNPNSISMEGGIIQRANVDVNAFSQRGENPNSWQINRAITGVTPGNFSVTAQLHNDYSTSNDPFRPQEGVLKTPSQFNEWASALKNDLKAYKGIQPGNAMGIATAANAQRAIDNMPYCSNPARLAQDKAMVNDLVRSLHIPKGAAIEFSSSYVSWKSAVSEVNTSLTGAPILINYDVIKNGLELINRQGKSLKDTELTSGVEKSSKIIRTIEQNGETTTTVKELNTSLYSLQQTSQGVMEEDIYSSHQLTMSEIATSSYQLPSLAAPGKVHPYNDLIAFLDPASKTLLVTPEFQGKILSSIGATPAQDGKYLVHTLTATRSPVTETISVKTADQSLIYATCANFSSKIFLGLPGMGTGNNVDSAGKEAHAKYDTSHGQFLKQDTINGTAYRFYKNAKCNKQSDEYTSECQPAKEWIRNAKGDRWEASPTGKHFTEKVFPIYHCVAGADFCTQMFTVQLIYYEYDDKNCKKLIDIKKLYNFSCQ